MPCVSLTNPTPTIPKQIQSYPIIPDHTQPHSIITNHTQSHPTTPNHTQPHSSIPSHTQLHSTIHNYTQSYLNVPNYIQSHSIIPNHNIIIPNHIQPYQTKSNHTQRYPTQAQALGPQIGKRISVMGLSRWLLFCQEGTVYSNAWMFSSVFDNVALISDHRNKGPGYQIQAIKVSVTCIKLGVGVCLGSFPCECVSNNRVVNIGKDK